MVGIFWSCLQERVELTSAMKQRGMSVFEPIDIRHGVHHDLSRLSTQEFIYSLLPLGIIWCLHLGTPCTVWSRARHAIRNTLKAQKQGVVRNQTGNIFS